MPAKNTINFKKTQRMLNSDAPLEQKKAFVQLKRISQKIVLDIVLNNGGTEHEAEEVLNETLEVVIQKIISNQFDEDRAKITTFIYGVANNKWKHQLRSKKNQSIHEHNFLKIHQRNEKEIFFEERREFLQEALLKLDDSCYSLLKEFYLKGKQLKDIAAEIEISYDTIRQRRKRCFNRLKEMFLKFYNT